MEFVSRHKRLIISVFILLGIVALSPVGTALRRYGGRVLARMSVSNKTDSLLENRVYSWELLDAEGMPVTFGAVKGQVVFLNFWATWCKPCIQEMPEIQKLYNDYGSEVAFLLVTKEDSSKVKPFLNRRKFDIPIFYSKSDIPKKIDSKTLPTTYIIDKNGKIIVAESGAKPWNSEKYRTLIDELLAR